MDTLQQEQKVEAVAWVEELSDMGCSEYHKYKNVTYFKCPLKNCELKEIQEVISDNFIPQRIGITKVSIEGD